MQPNRDPRRAYRVVDDFERELADYTGARYAVCVNSCTNAIYLSLVYRRTATEWSNCASLPRRTYVGVLQAVRNAEYDIDWEDAGLDDWQALGWYGLGDPLIIDSARRIASDMYRWPGFFVCLSFHAAKQLPLGCGGAILTDNPDAADWFRAARMDGRPPGRPIEDTVIPGWHMPMPPDVAARGLDILSRWNDAGYSPPPLPHDDYPDLSLL